MKLSIKNTFIISVVVLVISILLIFTIGYRVVFESSVQDIRQSMKSITQISAAKIQDLFVNVANSTKTLADQYLHIYENKKPLSKKEKEKWLRTLQKSKKASAFPIYGEDKDLKAPYTSILFYNDFNFTDEIMHEFYASLELGEIMKNMHSTFNFSWVYFTTVNDTMVIYPYLPHTMADDVYKPTKQHFYLAADFKNKTFGWEEPYVDLAGDGMMITVSYPVYKGETLVGVASRDITVDQLSSSLLKNTLIYDGTAAFIVDKSGKAISNSEVERQDEINEINKKDYRAILYYRTEDGLKSVKKDGIVNSKFNDMNLITEYVLKNYSKDEVSVSFSFESDKNYEVFAARVPVTGWYIISVIPDRSLFEASEKSFFFIAAFVLIAIFILSGLFGFAIGRNVILPIQILNEGAKKISSGDLNVEVSIDAKNEIGNLSQTFNRMAKNIKKSREELEDANLNLEKKVQIRTAELNEKNVELQNKNDTIMQSIEYAKTIQDSILPNRSQLEKYFSSYFIFWKPRDVVGGDLYWFHTIGANDYMIAVIDCTGHGVPGALMTMTANSLLNSIVSNRVKNDPGKILTVLNQEIKLTLRKSDSEYSADDGLDIGLCFISPKKKKMVYAGAKIPLYIVRNGIIESVDADKSSIGYRKTPEEAVFTNHEISIQGGEEFYMASDGYQSQIGGENQFPLGRKKFQELLFANSTKESDEQARLMIENYDRYRGTEEQIDDILVMGFKIK